MSAKTMFSENIVKKRKRPRSQIFNSFMRLGTLRLGKYFFPFCLSCIATSAWSISSISMSSTKKSFSEKVSELEQATADSARKVSSKEWCFPTLMIAGIAAPFLLLILLFFLQPSFVQRQEGDKYVRDGRKIFYWTVAITVILWLGMYLYSYCNGFDAAAMLCARK